MSNKYENKPARVALRPGYLMNQPKDFFFFLIWEDDCIPLGVKAAMGMKNDDIG